jgi:hypothetical protein
MLESQPQRIVGTTTSPSAVAGIDAVLLAACQLLNNPPPSEVSPSVASRHRERWCQPSAQQSRIPLAARVPSMAQAPLVLPNACPSVQYRAPMVSYTTMDLREEMNCHRCGEDTRTTIERHHERRQDIEGRNLEKDFNLHASVCGGLVAHAPLPPNSLGVWGGGA